MSERYDMPCGSLRRDWRFFFKHAGWIVGEKAVCAWHLARAEQFAQANGWEYAWEADEGADDSFVETWDAKARKEWHDRDHECLYCVLKNREGEVLASLGGIFDPDRNYGRVVEAELASEAMAEALKERPPFGIGKARR